ncbi:acyloxyacyl hydrolase [Algibacter lectus]|uniref:Lipid A 3-O-deacylase PagL n=2 Tax=Algibacter lectus TaxID=221126 RepID=A0A4R8MKX2_9FLAO|nr:acyloxyacyl hydrolase [Algibacter lectus]MWW24893.1 acyloxyacyl hydrolase [Algibacter lectus]TDY64696.1 lipid A 3-O-deacylase PagL [Algibacter lectus]SFD23547.1 Lipid A 3-O-deacylase (PagL) [Algibacter lectus]
MKLLYTCIFCVLFFSSFSQDKTHTSYLDLSYFKGNIALHNNDILHLIKGHPEGYLLSWNKKTYGFNDWEQRFNYPDYGVTYAYQNMKNDVLGNVTSLYAHFNFYFFNRNLQFRIGQGLGYTETPYDKVDNYRNIAYGSKLMSSTMVMLNYKKERIFDRFGLTAGFSLIHYSNANVKAPNASTNTLALNVGLTYNLDKKELEYQHTLADNDRQFTQPIKYNFVFRSGINESDIVDSGQYAFYVLSAYADKRINRKSALQFGADVFFSNFLKELIYYRSVAFPELDVSGDEDYKRVGVFVGHELFINRTSLLTQFGYYVYYPYDFEGQTYLRIGLKRYVGKQRKWFGAMTLKSHGAKAEAVEFGIGVRL